MGRANARPMMNSAQSGFLARERAVPDFAALHPGYGLMTADPAALHCST
jgi:hypothetical protein